ncbi:acid phosphatase [Novosphingobium sp. UBA1939]|uniref:acid phosphatase n=1 Tax=Novosphingobium sp. UBA1939 TaxID=1946982 RepID=UPI0025D064C6|nr:phosphatase PAP2 family protein [Novosphingobium sp. UBA1939]
MKRLLMAGTALLLASSALLASASLGPSGYLAPGAFDILAVLPPAPRMDDARGTADRAIFRATRALAGTPRWDLATSDVKLSPVDMMRDYSCAIGVNRTPENAPRTAALVRRAAFDTSRGSGIAKDFYKRERPFRYDEGPTCQPREELASSYDYPSGHTTLGWTWAMLLTALAPDRAAPILARGRAFGESRIVCGVHNLSAVEAGRLSATATLAAIEQTPDFQADLAAARGEIAALRADPATPKPDAGQCRQEAQLVAQKIF